MRMTDDTDNSANSKDLGNIRKFAPSQVVFSGRFASARALIIGSIAAAATSYLVMQAEMVVSSIRVGFLQFPPAAFGMLLLVTMLGALSRLISTKLRLSSTDLIVIYSMCLVSSMVSSHGVVEKFVPLLIAPGYGANSSNNWRELFWDHLQQRQVPFDLHGSTNQLVLTAFFARLQRGEQIPLTLWVTPLITWGVLIVLVLFAFLCLAAILRKQWVDNEKLSFPLAQLPLEITSDLHGKNFFRSKPMWFGVAIPVVVFTVKAFHLIYPVLPDIPLSWIINDYLTSPPWNNLAHTMVVISFAAIGFFFLLPVDILFSIWFFFVLSRVEQLVAMSYNINTPVMPLYPSPLFVGYQTIGAYLVLAGYFFVIARPHFRKVFDAATGKTKVDDSQELLPYRFAFWGLLASVAASSLYLWSMGMSLWIAVSELIVFLFVIAIVMARSTAEAGMLMTETTFRPVDILRMFIPLHSLGPVNLTQMAFFDNLFLRDQRGLVLTGMLDISKMSDGAKINRRAFVPVLVIGVMIALVVSTYLNICVPYQIGGARMDGWMMQGSPQCTWTDYQNYFAPGATSLSQNAWQMPVFFSVGVVITLILSAMRAAYFWWPLHPLGYALSGSWSTVIFWFPCLVAWMLKALSLRYGGMSFYVRCRPFFLGLVIGEFGMACILVLLSVWFKIPPPAFPWE